MISNIILSILRQIHKLLDRTANKYGDDSSTDSARKNTEVYEKMKKSSKEANKMAMTKFKANYFYALLHTNTRIGKHSKHNVVSYQLRIGSQIYAVQKSKTSQDIHTAYDIIRKGTYSYGPIICDRLSKISYSYYTSVIDYSRCVRTFNGLATIHLHVIYTRRVRVQFRRILNHIFVEFSFICLSYLMFQTKLLKHIYHTTLTHLHIWSNTTLSTGMPAYQLSLFDIVSSNPAHFPSKQNIISSSDK